MGVQEEGLSGGFSSWDDQVAEKTFVVGIEGLYFLSPVDKGGCDRIEEVVEALELAFIFEFFTGGTLPGITELEPVLIKRSTISPHTSENEETLIDELDCILIVLLSQLLETLILLFVVVELPVELINDASKTLDALHVTDWGDV
jgi:hypothetical protein